MVNNLTSSKFWGAGHYPKEYNPKVHGPYYPFRFYGKRKCVCRMNVTIKCIFNVRSNFTVIFCCSAEKSIWDLKVSEIPAFLSRRNAHPMAVAGAMSRGNIQFKVLASSIFVLVYTKMKIRMIVLNR